MIKEINHLKKKLSIWIKNKYYISGFIFFIWILFFDTNSILVQIQKDKKIDKLKYDIEYYNQAIHIDSQKINILSQDSLTPELEKYFREELFLSKKNEEIFLIQ